MKAEEFEAVLESLHQVATAMERCLRRGNLDGLTASARTLDRAGEDLEQHRLEMEAAETPSQCEDCEGARRVDVCKLGERLAEIERVAKITDEQIAVLTGGLRLESLAALTRRLDEIEEKHRNLNMYHDNHMKRCHTSTSVRR